MLLRSFLKKFGFIHQDDLAAHLDFARSVGKRLDEHRELVEEIELKTSLLDGDGFWHAQHLATQDDYLMRLYNLRHGAFPDDTRESQNITGDVVRPRPAILGRCRLPEYTGN